MDKLKSYQDIELDGEPIENELGKVFYIKNNIIFSWLVLKQKME